MMGGGRSLIKRTHFGGKSQKKKASDPWSVKNSTGPLDKLDPQKKTIDAPVQTFIRTRGTWGSDYGGPVVQWDHPASVLEGLAKKKTNSPRAR